jgi:hypothetical protein
MEIIKLKKICRFAEMKNTSRQTVFNAISAKKVTRIYIDGEAFIYLDEKTINWEPRRIVKKKKRKRKRKTKYEE